MTALRQGCCLVSASHPSLVWLAFPRIPAWEKKSNGKTWWAEHSNGTRVISSSPFFLFWYPLHPPLLLFFFSVVLSRLRLLSPAVSSMQSMVLHTIFRILRMNMSVVSKPGNKSKEKKKPRRLTSYLNSDWLGKTARGSMCACITVLPLLVY